MKPEPQFERDLAMVAPLSGCKYTKIKDTRSINASNRKTHKEVQRPCDAIISTPKINWLCECKVNYAKLKPHQAKLRDDIYAINGLFVVLRKVFLKDTIEYRIETKFGMWKTDDLKDIFELLNRDSWGIKKGE